MQHQPQIMKQTSVPADNNASDRLPDPQKLKLDDLGLLELEVAEIVEPYDRFQEIYKDYSLYFMIPNSGILGASIVNPDKSRAWAFTTEWDYKAFYADSWHLQIARRFVDEVLIKMTENLKIEIPITLEEIESVIISALEGGSNHWYFIDKAQIENLPLIRETLSEKIAQGLYDGNLTMPVYDCNEVSFPDSQGPPQGEVLGVLSTESLKKAFLIAATEYPSTFADLMSENLDGGGADTIFQLAVNGELIFC